MDINGELRYGAKIISKLNACNKTLRADQLKQNKKWDQKRKQWKQERKKWSQKLGGFNAIIQKLRTHDLKLIDEARHLQIENANKDISLAKSKAKNDIKSKKIRLLGSMIKILEGKLS